MIEREEICELPVLAPGSMHMPSGKSRELNLKVPQSLQTREPVEGEDVGVDEDVVGVDEDEGDGAQSCMVLVPKTSPTARPPRMSSMEYATE